MPYTPSILRDAEAVCDAIVSSTSVKGALELLGLRAAGGNYRGFHAALERFGLEPPQPGPDTIQRFIVRPDELVFCENSTYLNRSWIKRRLIAGGLPERCAICGLGPKWNGRPLSLQLDHANGVHNDNRRENLRLLCPNCHSQTATFAGRRRRSSGELARLAKLTARCPHCAASMKPTAQRCPACKRWIVPHGRKPKINWPDDETLLALVGGSSMVAVGKSLGVSDNAVRKHLRTRGLAA